MGEEGMSSGDQRMTYLWESETLFESFTKSDSDVHVELGMGTKHAVKGSGTVPFLMESGGVLRVMDMLWVPELRRSVLSVSVIEKKGFDVAFQDGQGVDQAQRI
jgi:hypothetical protein